MPAYYNEFEPYAADWLERLIAVGLLPDGDVDRRSILDVRPDDLKGYDQCHFFAGIGGWGLALRMVGWPDDRPVWTGSCPCQPFSVAGRREGRAGETSRGPQQSGGPCAASLMGHAGEPGLEGRSVSGRLRAYGNAIVPQVAAEFIGAYLDCRE